MTQVLITGGAGFIGSHTADLLIEAGHRVRVLDLLDPQIHGPDADWPGYLNPKVELVRGDVCDPQAVEAALTDVESVFHFAARTGVGQSMYAMRDYASTACVGTTTLLEVLAMRQAQRQGAKLKRLVLSSSRAVYGEGTFRCAACGVVYPPTRKRQDMEAGDFEAHCPSCGKPVEPIATAEDRPLAPISVYGWTKKHQEDYCLQAARAYDLPITALRYFNVYGSRQSLKNPYTGVVSVFYNRLMNHQPISLYERGLPRRDFVHVRDVAQANLLAMATDVEPGTCINIGGGSGDTIAELAQTLADVCGVQADLRDNGEFRVGDVWACYADIERARALLGFVPTMSLRQGMAEFADWARTQDSQDRYQQTVKELESHNLFGRAGAPAAGGRGKAST